MCGERRWRLVMALGTLAYRRSLKAKDGKPRLHPFLIGALISCGIFLGFLGVAHRADNAPPILVAHPFPTPPRVVSPPAGAEVLAGSDGRDVGSKKATRLSITGALTLSARPEPMADERGQDLRRALADMAAVRYGGQFEGIIRCPRSIDATICGAPSGNVR